MLAPIAWRVPPRHYGPWERVVSLLTEGLVAAGVEVTLFATAELAHGRPTQRRGALRLRGDARDGRQGVGGAAPGARLRPGGGVRPDPQPLRLPAADLREPGGHPDDHDHPRLLQRAHPAGVPRLRRSGTLRERLGRRPPPGPHVPRDHPPRPRLRGVHLPAAGGRVLAVLRPHPSGQGRGGRHPHGPRRRSAPRAGGHRARPGVLRARGRAAPGERHRATSARSARRNGTPCWAGRWACCTSSTSTSRSASRSWKRWRAARRSSPTPAAACRS